MTTTMTRTARCGAPPPRPPGPAVCAHAHAARCPARAQGEKPRADSRHQNRIRAYERSKLRYYYAVIDTDSVETAEHLYNECDGVELERTACKFDLRYVDDDEVFDHARPRDVCTSLSMATSSKSKDDKFTGLDFECKALQLTGVQCSWDVTDTKRTKILKRNFSEGRTASRLARHTPATQRPGSDRRPAPALESPRRHAEEGGH